MPESKVADSSDLYCDLEAEEQLIVYLAFEDFTQISTIDENIFFGKDHKIIFNALKKVQSVVPRKLFSDTIWRQVGTNDFEEISETINNILNAVNPKSLKIFETIKKDLEDLYLQREIITGSGAAKESAENGYLDDAVVALKSVLRTQVKSQIDTGEYVDDFNEREALIRSNAEKKGSEGNLIPTGLVQYDKLSGGIQKGEVGVVVGEIGGGKSVTLLNFGIHAYMQGFNVHFFGLEMQRFENQFRADSVFTDIPANMFRFANLTENDYSSWKKHMRKLKKERKNYFEFSFSRGVTITELLAFVEATEMQYNKKVDLLLLDYLSLLRSEGTHREFYMQQRETFIKLSDWAMTNQRAVWTASQSTDEGIKRKEGMRTIDVKYSRAIAEFTQIIVALYQGKEDQASNSLTFAVKKGRGFKKGSKITLKPDFSRMVLDQKSTLLNQGRAISKFKKGRKRLGR
jgi:replicative DNA helicase